MENLKIEIPSGANKIIQELALHGHVAYVVGGCVRDSVLGRNPADWDITTDALPEEVKEIFPVTIDTGIEHGTVTVRMNHVSYEVTTYRIDGDYEDGRHPKDVTFTRSLEEDLKRRDFTINAMAYNERAGLVDLFDGASDLEKGIVRCVGEARERFSEDALRMMRAFRFAAQLGFSIEKETAKAAKELSETLQKISAERIRTELVKLLCSGHPETIRDLYRANLTKQFLPEFDRCMETEQNSPYHYLSVGEHTIAALCAVRKEPALRLAMLLHDIAKPEVKTTDEKGTDHFKTHAEKSAKAASRILRRLKFDNKTIRRVKNLVENHDITIGRDLTPHAVRSMMHRVGKEDFPLLIEVMEADNGAKAPEVRCRLEKETEILRARYKEILAAGDAIDLKDLAVTGADLMACGVPEGKELGSVLERMLRDVLRVPEHNRKDYLLAPSNLRHFRTMQDKQKRNE